MKNDFLARAIRVLLSSLTSLPRYYRTVPSGKCQRQPRAGLSPFRPNGSATPHALAPRQGSRQRALQPRRVAPSIAQSRGTNPCRSIALPIGPRSSTFDLVWCAACSPGVGGDSQRLLLDVNRRSAVDGKARLRLLTLYPRLFLDWTRRAPDPMIRYPHLTLTIVQPRQSQPPRVCLPNHAIAGPPSCVAADAIRPVYPILIASSRPALARPYPACLHLQWHRYSFGSCAACCCRLRGESHRDASYADSRLRGRRRAWPWSLPRNQSKAMYSVLSLTRGNG